jgi:glycosyltransferase involved in cell wall biosynthesis
MTAEQVRVSAAPSGGALAADEPRRVAPALSVVIPTYNNLPVLRQCIESWERWATDVPVELIVIEDGCRDETPAYLERVSREAWGRRHLRWCHAEDLHELRCTNRGISLARGPLIAAWQDDMFVQTPWFARELVSTFAAYPEIGLLSLSRGLNCFPFHEPIRRWEDLHDTRRQLSSVGPAPLNWVRLAEVDIVIRPWVVRSACIDKVGALDEAFVPTEWDEADLCYRIRDAGWKVATHAYERLGAYRHLGSTTLSQTMSERYKERVLQNGRLFHERWDPVIRRNHPRQRRSWGRRASAVALVHTAREMVRHTAWRLSHHHLRSRAGSGSEA